MSKGRPAEQFGVRRWLALGAASAGVSAALVGFALVGPETGTAAADSSDTSSVSSHATSDRVARAETRRDARKAAREERHRTSRDADRATHGDADDAAAPDSAADVAEDHADAADAGAEKSEPAADGHKTAVRHDDPAPTDGDTPVEATIPTEPVDADPVPSDPVGVPAPTREQRVAAAIATMTASAQAWIDSRPVSDSRKEALEDLWFATRRSLLNQAPTVNPVQVTGAIDGPVTGTVGAVDPDGDRMVYRLVKGPATGTVRLNRDGTYTYTPGEGFDGVDTFVVRARDLGLHVNVLDLFRPLATRAVALINQGAITFDFQYGTGADYWTPERRAALQQVANNVAAYFRVTAPVVLSYDIQGVEDSSVGWLAGADSPLISDEPGIWASVVQNKLQTGVDSNDDKTDGVIEWNFGFSWALGDDVGPGQYDFTSVAMHELLHTFGFGSEVLKAPGNNSATQVWSIWDSFLSTADGTRLLGSDYQWSAASDAYLTGGLYFGGANAVDAYGKPVPVYSPARWQPGSSAEHLDDNTFTGDDSQLMNHAVKAEGAQSVRVISPIELGILRDLGYTVVPVSHEPAATSQAIVEQDSPGPIGVPAPTREQRAAAAIASMTSSALQWIADRPVSDAQKVKLELALRDIRRALFNQAPTVNPVQVSGVIDGPITGTVGAEDPDGDRIAYRLVTRPTTGTVQLNRDGSYTYTPGEGFDGVDTFVVRARDLGLHVNLLDLFRPIGTRATALINQGAIRFDFTYGSGAEYWTPERKAALQRAADAVAAYFIVTQPVSLTYDVTAIDDPESRILASATSVLAGEDPGIWRTVVQDKIITGHDSNFDIADGYIDWNFGVPWATGDAIAANEFDFQNTAIHELLHSLGILGMVGAPGTNTGNIWTVWDSFLASADGTRLMDGNGDWLSTSDAYLTGLGGVFFGGANAIAAYGGKPVPLYSPAVWEPGSSATHLDSATFSGDDYKVMNEISKGPGPGNVRTLSGVELGILADLGYTVRAQVPTQASFALTGFVFLLRRRKSG